MQIEYVNFRVKAVVVKVREIAESSISFSIYIENILLLSQMQHKSTRKRLHYSGNANETASR